MTPEKRLRRSERAVNFNRPADGQPGRITFSASTAEAALRPGAQDRLSWMVQLAARLAGSSPKSTFSVSLTQIR